MPTVLLIDDDPKIAGLLRRSTRIYPDWQFITVTDGARAIDLLRAHQSHIDVVLLDVVMPGGMDGRLVCAGIRELYPKIPIIPFTAAPEALPVLEEYSCCPPLLKPVAFDKLFQQLRAAVEDPPTPRSPSAVARYIQSYAINLAMTRGDQHDRTMFGLTERDIVPQALLDDLDLDRVAQHVVRAVKLRGYDGPIESVAFLRHHGFVTEIDGDLLPTLVGILAFAGAPERLIPASGIDIVQFASVQPSQAIRFQQQVRGPITDQIERAVHTLCTLDLTESREDHQYPIVALRELTINAIAHRNWSSTGSRVRIQVFPNRIEWVSPGGLPPGVTTHTMCQAQVSRNPRLMQYLYREGLVEALGTGIDAVENALYTSGCEPLEVQDAPTMLIVCVRGKSLETARLARAGLLTRRQSNILAEVARRGTATTTELAAAFNLSDQTVLRELRRLRTLGVIVMEGHTHTLRYRLVEPCDRIT